MIHYSFAVPAGWVRKEPPGYTMTVRVAAGQEIAYITEEYNLGDAQVYREPAFTNAKDALLGDRWAPRPQETPNNFCFSFLGPYAPTRARVITENVTSPDKGMVVTLDGEDDYPLRYQHDRLEFTLNPWTYRQPDQSALFTTYRADDPHSDIVALLPCMASRWRNPDMLPHVPKSILQYTETNDLRIYTSEKPDFFLRAPLTLGRREWAIAMLRNPGIVTGTLNATVDAGLLRKVRCVSARQGERLGAGVAGIRALPAARSPAARERLSPAAAAEPCRHGTGECV